MHITPITQSWTNVVQAVVQREPAQGTFALDIYNADESKAGSSNLEAVVIRAALLEATAFIKEQGWDPTGRWSDSSGTISADFGISNELFGFSKDTAIRRFRRHDATD
jgi:hypothetical protein